MFVNMEINLSNFSRVKITKALKAVTQHFDELGENPWRKKRGTQQKI